MAKHIKTLYTPYVNPFTRRHKGLRLTKNAKNSYNHTQKRNRIKPSRPLCYLAPSCERICERLKFYKTQEIPCKAPANLVKTPPLTLLMPLGWCRLHSGNGATRLNPEGD